MTCSFPQTYRPGRLQRLVLSEALRLGWAAETACFCTASGRDRPTGYTTGAAWESDIRFRHRHNGLGWHGPICRACPRHRIRSQELNACKGRISSILVPCLALELMRLATALFAIWLTEKSGETLCTLDPSSQRFVSLSLRTSSSELLAWAPCGGALDPRGWLHCGPCSIDGCASKKPVPSRIVCRKPPTLLCTPALASDALHVWQRGSAHGAVGCTQAIVSLSTTLPDSLHVEVRDVNGTSSTLAIHGRYAFLRASEHLTQFLPSAFRQTGVYPNMGSNAVQFGPSDEGGAQQVRTPGGNGGTANGQHQQENQCGS